MYAVDKELESHHTVIQAIYEKVILESSKVLRNAKMFSIDILKQEDPSYSEMAEILHKVCNLIDHLVETNGLVEHEWTCVKARDYSKFVADVAKAIAEDDEVELERLTEEMDKRSFL